MEDSGVDLILDRNKWDFKLKSIRRRLALLCKHVGKKSSHLQNKSLKCVTVYNQNEKVSMCLVAFRGLD